MFLLMFLWVCPSGLTVALRGTLQFYELDSDTDPGSRTDFLYWLAETRKTDWELQGSTDLSTNQSPKAGLWKTDQWSIVTVVQHS